MHVIFNFYVFHIVFNLFVVSITISLDTYFVFKRHANIFSILDIKLIYFLPFLTAATLYRYYPKYTYESHAITTIKNQKDAQVKASILEIEQLAKKESEVNEELWEKWVRVVTT